MTKIYYFDAYSGAGKTHAAVLQADRLARMGEKVLLVQPTKILLDETLEHEINPLNPLYTVSIIHGETVEEDEAVTKRIIDHFKNVRPNEGEIVGITHSAFMQVQYFHARENWTVIVDEVLTVSLAGTINMPDTHHLLTRYLTSTSVDAKYSELAAVNDGRAVLSKIATNKNDDSVYRVMHDIARYLADPNYKVFVIAAQYERMLINKSDSRIQLSWFAELQPTIFDGFKKTIVMSALMKYQLTYALWTNAGVAWEPVPDSWRKTLRYETHENGKTMQCHYAGIADWSKRGRDEVTANGETRWSEVTRAVLDLIGDRRTIWMANKDTDADVQKIIADKLAADQERDPNVTTSSIVQLPNTPHGMNIFQDATCCVVTSALNASPAHFAFLASRGVDPNALRTATYRSAVYQAWMRSSARNPAAGSNKMLIVMDRDTADFMANEVFPGMRVAPVPGLGLGRDRSRPRKYAVGIDRKKAYADGIKQELLDELLALNETDIRSLAQRDEGEIEKQGHHILLKVDEVKIELARRCKCSNR